ncbi:MAG: diguanylate cyclase [Desulfovibrionaceae bacterium]|nr:diguanylate cyclase [Desulfovibrionaceae bacterium]MBF0513415.1 diguanylate cyclase [Desulfovibrionaceae bacterium]
MLTTVPMDKKTTVLIVEDEAIIALDIRQRLTKLGYAPFEEIPGDSPAAIEAASRLKPSLALMDVTLAGPMDGIEAAGVIISRHDIPVVFLTAHADEKTLARAKAAGCHGYVIKPIDERWLLTALEMALAQHDAEDRLKKSERLFRSIFDNAAAGIVMTDAQGRILRVNATFAAMLGHDPGELAGRPGSELVHPDDAAQALERFRELAGGALTEHRAEERFLRRDGTPIWLDSSAKAVPGEDGQAGMVVWVMIDATKRKALEEELLRQAGTDYLTGISNRREYIHLSERELSRAKRHDAPLAALSMDIDHFKRINDTYGHNAGDEVLRLLAREVQANLREHDIFGRIGGEEFAVTLIECPVHEAMEIAERLRLALSKIETGEAGRGASFTVSIGVAAMSGGDSLDVLLARADDALYAAKRGGRNKVMLAGDAAPKAGAREI